VKARILVLLLSELAPVPPPVAPLERPHPAAEPRRPDPRAVSRNRRGRQRFELALDEPFVPHAASLRGRSGVSASAS